MADSLLYGDDDTSKSKTRLQILEQYGRHADAEEEKGDPSKIRRFIIKALSPLFTGELNAKRYRVALDAIAGIPKQRKSEGKSMAGQPPLSELIMAAAIEHLSEEVLTRTPEESYERVLWQEQKRSMKADGGRSPSIDEWQARRKEESSKADSDEDQFFAG